MAVGGHFAPTLVGQNAEGEFVAPTTCASRIKAIAIAGGNATVEPWRPWMTSPD